MREYVLWLWSSLDPFHIVSALHAAEHLVFGSSVLFWLVGYVFVRYTLPDIVLWCAYVLRPRSFDPPGTRRYGAAEPLVSVIIAGRNPGQRIVASIRSVLESDYRNVEVIFADDCSSDDSVALARTFERTGHVRVFANRNHSGKPANLNLALAFARGEFVFVLDADTQIFPDTIAQMLPYFDDPRVGAVSASIRVRNRTANALTRFQQIEYLLTYTLTQLWRDRLGIIAIVCGMGAMFRTSALRGLGGYDMGLGDDTDMTLRLRKARWRLRTALTARISTDVPQTLWHLVRQRARWARNMVKVRLRKHRDMATLRYGVANAVVFYETLLNRTIRPVAILAVAVYVHLTRGAEMPVIVGSLYAITTVALAVKVLIARDMAGEPALGQIWLVPFYALYRVPIWLTQVTQIVRELLYLKPWHPYVPRRIWEQIPHH